MAEITSTVSTYDYSMIGSIGSDAVQSVNGEMINKMRAAEERGTLASIDRKLESWDLETEKIDEIKAKVTEFAGIMNFFDISSDENVFNQVLTETTGDSVMFDAVKTAGLDEGTTKIWVEQLAQKDVFQSEKIGAVGMDEDSNISVGQTVGDNISIEVDGETFVFNAYTLDDDGVTTTAKSYKTLAAEIAANSKLQASYEAVGTNTDDPANPYTEYRMIIKSEESGVENSLTITYNNDDDADGTATVDDADQTGFNSLFGDMSSGSANHVMEAKNLKAKVDGVAFDIASNTLTLSGNLTMTAVKTNDPLDETDTTNITITKDTSAALIAVQELATQYNSIIELVNEELNSAESDIEDKSTLRTILADIKNMFFANYGADTIEWGTDKDEYGDIVYNHSNVTNNDKNLFNYGFSLDQYGNLSVDTDDFTEALTDNLDDLQALFVGAHENKGLGTQLNEYLTGLDGYEGLLSSYSEKMDDRKETITEDREKEVKNLDAKYDIMAQQFSEYASVISQMESTFSGLEMMIKQSTASN